MKYTSQDVDSAWNASLISIIQRKAILALVPLKTLLRKWWSLIGKATERGICFPLKEECGYPSSIKDFSHVTPKHQSYLVCWRTCPAWSWTSSWSWTSDTEGKLPNGWWIHISLNHTIGKYQHPKNRGLEFTITTGSNLSAWAGVIDKTKQRTNRALKSSPLVTWNWKTTCFFKNLDDLFNILGWTCWKILGRSQPKEFCQFPELMFQMGDSQSRLESWHILPGMPFDQWPISGEHPCKSGFSWKESHETEKMDTWSATTLPETNIAPENGWLEDYFPFGEAYFQVLC